jgi:hypothetical protein
VFTARYGLSLNIIEVNLSVQRVKAIVQQQMECNIKVAK